MPKTKTKAAPKKGAAKAKGGKGGKKAASTGSTSG